MAKCFKPKSLHIRFRFFWNFQPLYLLQDYKGLTIFCFYQIASGNKACLLPLNKKKISPGWRGFLKPLFADFKIGNNIQFWEYWLLWFIEGKQYLAFKESMYCKSKNAAHNKIQIKQYKEKDVDKLNKTSWDNLADVSRKSKVYIKYNNGT